MNQNQINFNGVTYEKEKTRETDLKTDGLIETPKKEVIGMQEMVTANYKSAQQAVGTVATTEDDNSKDLSTESENALKACDDKRNIIVEHTTKDLSAENALQTYANERNIIVERTTKDLSAESALQAYANERNKPIEYIVTTKDLSAENALQAYANERNIPIEYLTEKWKITSNANGEISIPYFDENETVIDTKIINSNGKSTWEQKKEPLIYGEWRLSKYTDEYIIIVPDEQNAQVLWANKIQGIAVNKTVLSVELGIMLGNYKEIYVLKNGTDFTDVLYSRLQNIVDKNKLYSIDTQNYNYSDFVALNVNNALTLDTLLKQKFKLVPIAPADSKATEHVAIAQKVIDNMQLVSYENDLYTYKGGVYKLATDKEIISYILKFIKPEAKPTLCKQAIYYIRHTLDDTGVEINHDVVNYQNGLFDLNTRAFIEHTPDIFSINQLSIDYIEIEKQNADVEKFLNDICSNIEIRKTGLLQKIGYGLTTRNNIQKAFIFYGPSGSNGKSFTLKILETIVGSSNVSHKGLDLLAEGFEVKGIKGKQLNISFELPVTTIKDTSVFKSTTTGDTIETKVKFNPETLVIVSYVKHFFATNYFPDVKDTTNGMFRRCDIQPFENQFDPANTTFHEQEFLSQENLNYIGRRALDEYLKMVDSGKLIFANEEESNKLVREFENSNDSVKAFITQEDYFPESAPLIKLRTDFWKMYELYCDDNFVKKVGKKQFYTELTSKYGFNVKVTNGEYYLYRNPKINK